MKEKIRIETYKRADGKYGIAIHKKEKMVDLLVMLVVGRRIWNQRCVCIKRKI